jgi:hypothetical protein
VVSPHRTDENEALRSRGAEPRIRTALSLPLRFGIAVFCAFLTVFIIVGLPPGLGTAASITTRILAAVILLIIVTWFCWRNYYRPMMDSHLETKVWPLPDAQVYVLQRSAGRLAVTLEQARTFALVTLAPTLMRERITERYEPSQRTLVQRVTIEAHLSEGLIRPSLGAKRKETSSGDSQSEREHDSAGITNNSILVPLLIPPKGVLVDNLRVRDAADAELPVLSHRQYLQVVANVLRTLLNVAYGEPLDEKRHAQALRAEHMALTAVMRRGRALDDISGVEAIRQLGDAPNQEALTLAARLVEKLTSNYAIVAPVPWPPDRRFVVSYERWITPSLQLADINSGFLRWLKARARLLLGARPVDIRIPLENACTSQSYHLIIDGHDGVFVGSQRSSRLERYCQAHADRGRELLKKKKIALLSPPPYFRFRRRAGQRYGHFYTRFFPEPIEGLREGDELPGVRFRFYEVPPGSIFRAAVAAFAGTLLLWLIGFVSSRKADPGTDVPAFLLVFPAIAAAWLGYEGTGARRLLEGTLAARISLLITALCSIAGSGLFMIFKAQLSYLHWRNPYHMHILGNASLSWNLLILISCLNALMVSFLYLTRAWVFMHLSSRPDELATHHEYGD